MDLTSPRNNPFVGPRAFQTGESLYGRDRELRDLLNFLLSQRIILLYSPSGAGKTSLIHAGLIPSLQDKGFSTYPVMRLNLEPPAGIEAVFAAPGGSEAPPSFNRYIYSALLSLEEGLPDDQQIPSVELAGLTLEAYLARQTRPRPASASDQPEVEVLIFDQFEEILTVEPTDMVGKTAFFSQVGDALLPRSRWALFSMREDFIAALDPYLRYIPTHLNNRYRLDLLGAEAARLAVQRPARHAQVEFTDAAAQKLVDDLRRVQVQRPDGSMDVQLGGYVEPVQLQVVCYRLWQNLAPGQSRIDDENLARTGDVDQSLSEYYAERVAAIAAQANVRERLIRNWFERSLITEGGIRGQVQMGPARSGDLENSAIRLLEDAHLVRAEKRRGVTWFELAHDRLIEPVRRNNAAWFQDHLSPLQRQAGLWEEENRPSHLLLREQALLEAQDWADQHPGELTPGESEFLGDSQEAYQREIEAQQARQRQLEMAQKLAETEKQRAEEQARDARRLRWLVAGLGVVLLMAIGLALLASSAQRAASASAREAANQAATATNALGFSQIQAATATHALGLSQVQGTLAAENAATAQAASTQAIVQADAARTAQAQIAFARQLAAQARQLPDSNPARRPDAILLAVEAMRRYPESTTSQALAEALSLQPRPVARMEHDGAVIDVAFNPDGKYVVSGSWDGTARVWEAASGKEVSRMQHDDYVDSVAFSPDGKNVVSASHDGTARVWEAASGREVARLVHDSAVWSVAFSPDGEYVGSGSGDGTARVWEAASGREVARMAHDGAINAVAFSPDGEYVVSGSIDGTARVWEALSGREVARMAHDGPVSSVAFSPDGEYVVSGSEDGTARVWEAASGREVARMAHDRPVSSVAFSPDGEYVVSGSSDNTARVWEAASGREVARMEHGDFVNDVAFSPDGEYVVSGSRDNTARVWEAASGREVTRMAHDRPVNAVAFSPDGEYVVSGSKDNMARVWEVSYGREVARMQHGGQVYAVAFSPDG
jgi:WD40 repeat protein